MTDEIDPGLADIARLLADPVLEHRVATAGRVAQRLAGRLSDDERKLAEELVRLFIKDATVSVRAALAENLAHNPNLPRDIAITLSADVAAVAVPLVRASEVLTDEDLIDIVRSAGTEVQRAVALRDSVSEAVSDALVDTGKAEIVATVVANKGAVLSEPTLLGVAQRFGSDELVAGPLVARPQLPISVSERLINLLSAALRDELVARQVLPDDLASDLVLQARERAVMALIGAETKDAAALAAQLHAGGRLTFSIVLRALCMGDLPFFEAALACLAGIPVTNAALLIADARGTGLPQLMAKAGVPANYLDVFRTAAMIASESQYDGGPNDRERYRHRVIQRLLTSGDRNSLDNGNIEYLVAKLGATS